VRLNSSTLIYLYDNEDNSGIYYNRHLRDAFIEDLMFFDSDFRLKDYGNDDPEPST